MCDKLNFHTGGKKWCSPDLALLILRVALGLIFVAHGLSKINNMEATVGFFAMFSIPAFFAYIVAWVEFLAGIAMILGLYTWVAGILIALVMAFAIILVKSKGGDILKAEIDFMAFASALTIAFIGPGKFALMKDKSRYCALGCSTGKCDSGVCKDSCTDKCSSGGCNCGDCPSCKGEVKTCSHDMGCKCGDCNRCK